MAIIKLFRGRIVRRTSRVRDGVIKVQFNSPEGGPGEWVKVAVEEYHAGRTHEVVASKKAVNEQAT